MGQRAIKKPTEQLSVYIKSDSDDGLKKELQIYNHQAIDYFNYSTGDHLKKFTFNYYDPCGSQLPKSVNSGIEGNDLLLFTTSMYNELLKNISTTNFKNIIKKIDNLRNNFRQNKDEMRYKDIVKLLIETQFKYLAHFISNNRCVEPDSCHPMVLNDKNDEVIDYLNETLHFYVKEEILGNMFTEQYIVNTVINYFGLELTGQSHNRKMP